MKAKNTTTKAHKATRQADKATTTGTPATAPDADRDAMTALLGVSVSNLNRLARAGVIVRAGRGRYKVAESIQGYVKYLRDGAESGEDATSYSAARARLTAAKAGRAVLELEILRGEHIPKALVDEGLLKTMTLLRSRLLGFGGEMPPHLEGLPAAEVERVLRSHIDRLIVDLVDSLDGLARKEGA
jgi:phage terminase Nu1 subunit (DNA packaging protein)